MEELRIAFLVIGSIFIVGVLVHGIWKMRRQDSVPPREQEKIEPRSQFDEAGYPEQPDEEQSNKQEFDEFGIGSVRVITPETEPKANVSTESFDEIPVITDEKSDDSELAFANNEFDEPESDSKEAPLYASVVTQPKPHMSVNSVLHNEQIPAEKIPEPPSFLLKETEDVPIQSEPDFGLSRPPTPPRESHSEKHPPKDNRKSVLNRTGTRKRKEPTLGEDQMRIDFDEPKVNTPTDSSNERKTLPETEVLAINVRSSEDNPLSGAALLPLLLTLGFKFGEHDIFHRHVNANGKGPILFSLANMVKPGVFDIDNLETFTTQGVSLFMVLPIEGDPHQVFNMMHNAARKIADEFNAQLLDGRRSILTKQGIQQYVEKIREFERQRIIASNSTR